MSFDGTDDWLGGEAVLAAGSDAFTIIAVWRPRKTQGAQVIFEQSQAPMSLGTRASLLAVEGAYGFNGESNDAHGLVPFAAEVWRLSVLALDGKAQRNVHLFDGRNDEEVAGIDVSVQKLGTGGTRVGAKLATGGECLEGDVAEIIVFDRELSDEERLSLASALQAKWRLELRRDARAERVLDAAKKYLNLPVKNGAPKRWVSVLVDGAVVRDFEIELADSAETADWWAFLDLAPFRGKAFTVRVDRLPEGAPALLALEVSDSFRDSESLYREPLRPQFHFSPRRGWNNDPNGLVYHEGEYHLFFQHNPYGWNWGNMHWGHAVSPDLVRWKELDEAIYPDGLGTAFSGSAVVDEGNTAGFARAGEPALVCIYTAAGGTNRESRGVPFSQCLVYSTDRGRTWTPYAGNPVLPHIVGGNRDPKVFWAAAWKKWIMAIYLDGNDFALFDSPDLKAWRRISDVRIPGDSECPEFFEIAVDPAAPDGAWREGAGLPGDTPRDATPAAPRETRWIFYGGKCLYLVGRFDGTTFTPESGPHPLQRGNCFYASQTYNDVPDGRRVLVPWGQVAMPGMPFNQMMGLPVALTLRSGVEGLRLSAYPVRELESLRTKARTWRDAPLEPDEDILRGVEGELFDIVCELAPGKAREVAFELRGFPVVYDVGREELRSGDHRAPLPLVAGRVRLRILVDRVSVDVFGGDGRLYMPMQFHPAPAARSLKLSARRRRPSDIPRGVRDAEHLARGRGRSLTRSSNSRRVLGFAHDKEMREPHGS